MFNLEDRQQTVRARAFDVAELFHLATHGTTRQEEVEVRLRNLIVSALYACRKYEQLQKRVRGWPEREAAGGLGPEILLDRLKGIIELELPFLLLLTGRSQATCRTEIADLIGRQLEEGLWCRQIIATGAETAGLPAGETEGTRTLLQWCLAAIDGVFQAQEHIREQRCRRIAEPDVGLRAGYSEKRDG